MTEEDFVSKEREYQLAAMLLVNSAANNLALVCTFKPSKKAVMALLLFAASVAVEGDADAIAQMEEMCRTIIDDAGEAPASGGTVQ